MSHTKPVPRRRKKPAVEWTPKADTQLLAMRLEQNKKWLEIGQALGRDPATCMTRFESTLNPVLSKFWTAAKDKELGKHVSALKSWPDIAQSMGVHRLACMERWRAIELQNRSETDPIKVARRRSEKDSTKTTSTLSPAANINLKVVEQVDKDLDRSSWNSLLRGSQRFAQHGISKKKTVLGDFAQLHLINPRWSAKEETILIQFVLSHGLHSWDTVAKDQLKGRFTAAECRSCWKNLDMPVAKATSTDLSASRVNNPTARKFSAKDDAFGWDKELSVRLQAVIRQGYKSKTVDLDDINWQWVARNVHPDVTSRVCKNHWKFLHERSSSVSRVVWRHEDIKRLEEGIRILGPNRMTEIRDYFLPGMTKDDVMRHWYKISDKATLIDEEEYYRLLEIIQELRASSDVQETSVNTSLAIVSAKTKISPPASGIDWAEVAKRMGHGWTRLPCKRVWESSFDYLVLSGTDSKSPTLAKATGLDWTSNEDNMLLRMVKFVGRDDWFSVARALQLGKTAWQCRLRWCQLLGPVDLDTQDLTVQGEPYC
ncbi:hypothetical protein BGZ83_011636 [Gryganskiella cystojenkinii]|nr:hypothetical protein BGZ83_011636 [Gryganskiella cystojenkinii]